jgi:hypothetical protein
VHDLAPLRRIRLAEKPHVFGVKPHVFGVKPFALGVLALALQALLLYVAPQAR